MKIRKVQVAIKSEGQFWQDFKTRVTEFAQSARTGKEVKPHADTLVFDSLAEMAKVLTPKRLELLGLIRRHHPESVRELAAFAGRDIKNVSEDVRVLEQYGLLTVEKNGKTSRHRKRLTADYERLDVQVYL
jgi:predicted transcriptional regulator